MARYNVAMPRVGEFCPSNIARLVLTVIIVVTLLLALGVFLYHSPGHGQPLKPTSHTSDSP
ncbi:MAG: hypothetical protein WA510_00190 [Acidobacteriaceae bacterium]